MGKMIGIFIVSLVLNLVMSSMFVSAFGFSDSTSDTPFGFPDREGLTINPDGNYSINVNNTDYWNGYPWSLTRWLDIDGGNANQDVDIGTYGLSAGQLNVTDGTNGWYNDIIDYSGIGAGTLPFLRPFGSVYNLLALYGGVNVVQDPNLNISAVWVSDNDLTDANFENAVYWYYHEHLSRILINQFTGEVDMYLDGNYYQGGNLVCDNSNNCAYLTTETDPLWTGNQTNYYNKTDVYNKTETYNQTEVDDLIDSAGIWENSTGQIKPKLQQDVNLTQTLYVEEIKNQEDTTGLVYNETVGCWGVV